MVEPLVGRRVFVAGLSLFTFASLIGGFAQVQWVLHRCPCFCRASIIHDRIDWAGAIAVTMGLVLMVYAFIQAPETGWKSLSTAYLLMGAIALLTLYCLD